MAAEGDLNARREPADPVIAVVANDEGRLRKIILGSQCLEQRVSWIILKNHHCCRVSRELARRECVDLEETSLHGSRANGRRLSHPAFAASCVRGLRPTGEDRRKRPLSRRGRQPTLCKTLFFRAKSEALAGQPRASARSRALGERERQAIRDAQPAHWRRRTGCTARRALCPSPSSLSRIPLGQGGGATSSRRRCRNQRRAEGRQRRTAPRSRPSLQHQSMPPTASRAT